MKKLKYKDFAELEPGTPVGFSIMGLERMFIVAKLSDKSPLRSTKAGEGKRVFDILASVGAATYAVDLVPVDQADVVNGETDTQYAVPGASSAIGSLMPPEAAELVYRVMDWSNAVKYEGDDLFEIR